MILTPEGMNKAYHKLSGKGKEAAGTRGLIAFPDKKKLLKYSSLYLESLKQEIKMIKKELLEILACPKCKGPLKLTEKGDGLICETCKLVYEIRDDIPIMLIDEARPLE